MPKLDLAKIISFDIKSRATVVDQKFETDLEKAIASLIRVRVEVEEIKRHAGGELPSSGLLIIGSTLFNDGEKGLYATVHCIEERRLRRKGE